jgi:hypothetical protein
LRGYWWTVDFRGQFRTQDQIYCYPLAIAGPLRALAPQRLVRTPQHSTSTQPASVAARGGRRRLPIYVGSILLAKLDEREMIMRE